MVTDEVVVGEEQHVCEKNKVVDNEKISVSDVIHDGPFYAHVLDLVEGDPWGPMYWEYYVPVHKKCGEVVGSQEVPNGVPHDRSGSTWSVKHQTFVWPYDSQQGSAFTAGRAR